MLSAKLKRREFIFVLRTDVLTASILYSLSDEVKVHVPLQGQ